MLHLFSNHKKQWQHPHHKSSVVGLLQACDMRSDDRSFVFFEAAAPVQHRDAVETCRRAQQRRQHTHARKTNKKTSTNAVRSHGSRPTTAPITTATTTTRTGHPLLVRRTTQGTSCGRARPPLKILDHPATESVEVLRIRSKRCLSSEYGTTTPQSESRQASPTPRSRRCRTNKNKHQPSRYKRSHRLVGATTVLDPIPEDKRIGGTNHRPDDSSRPHSSSSGSNSPLATPCVDDNTTTSGTGNKNRHQVLCGGPAVLLFSPYRAILETFVRKETKASF